MQKNVGFVWLCLSILLAGCSSAPLVTIPPDWLYEKDAISLHIKADKQLNLFQKTPHALLLCIYHLRDPNAFNQLLNEKDGLIKLLECGRFDPSVVLARQLVIQPGQELTETMDRSEGAKFVNIAAGYYNLHKEKVIRSYPVPLSGEKHRGNLIQKTKKLAVNIRLSPAAIEDVAEVSEVKQKK